MRTIVIAMLTAAGIGLVGTSSTFAAPASGAAIADLAAAESLIADARMHTQRVCVRWHVVCKHFKPTRRHCVRQCKGWRHR